MYEYDCQWWITLGYCLSLKDRKPADRTHRHTFCSCDLDLGCMTSIYELDLGILKMYPGTKNEVSRSRLSKVKQNRQTDRQMRDRTYALPLMRRLENKSRGTIEQQVVKLFTAQACSSRSPNIMAHLPRFLPLTKPDWRRTVDVLMRQCHDAVEGSLAAQPLNR